MGWLDSPVVGVQRVLPAWSHGRVGKIVRICEIFAPRNFSRLNLEAFQAVVVCIWALTSYKLGRLPLEFQDIENISRRMAFWSGRVPENSDALFEIVFYQIETEGLLEFPEM